MKKKQRAFAGAGRTTDFLITIPGLVLYAFLFMVPVGMGIYYSFTDWNGGSKSYDIIGFQNYIKLFSDKRFLGAMGFTVKYTVLLITGVVIISLTTALILNSSIKFSDFFKSMFFFPAVLSLMTVGLIFKEIYYRALPLLGGLLNIEVLKTNILANPDLAMYGILFANIWTASAIPMVLFYAGLKNVPTDLYEAAGIDGATVWQKFKSITIPYILPTFSMVFILQLKNGLSVFDYVMALTGGGPGGATESIGVLIYKGAFEERRFGYAVSESVILLIVIAAVSLVQVKMTKSKEVNA